MTDAADRRRRQARLGHSARASQRMTQDLIAWRSRSGTRVRPSRCGSSSRLDRGCRPSCRTGAPSPAALSVAASNILANRRPTLAQWRDVLIGSLRNISPTLTEFSPPVSLLGTRIAPLFSSRRNTQSRAQAATALGEVAQRWMNGVALTQIAGRQLAMKPMATPSVCLAARYPRSSLWSRAALVSAYPGRRAYWRRSPRFQRRRTQKGRGGRGPSRHALDLLPLAIRFGTNNLATTAWYRWGVRRRRLAHVLAREFRLPMTSRQMRFRDGSLRKEIFSLRTRDLLASSMKRRDARSRRFANSNADRRDRGMHPRIAQRPQSSSFTGQLIVMYSTQASGTERKPLALWVGLYIGLVGCLVFLCAYGLFAEEPRARGAGNVVRGPRTCWLLLSRLRSEANHRL